MTRADRLLAGRHRQLAMLAGGLFMLAVAALGMLQLQIRHQSSRSDELAANLQQTRSEADLRGTAVSTLATDVRRLRAQVQAAGRTPVAPDRRAGTRGADRSGGQGRPGRDRRQGRRARRATDRMDLDRPGRRLLLVRTGGRLRSEDASLHLRPGRFAEPRPFGVAERSVAAEHRGPVDAGRNGRLPPYLMPGRWMERCVRCCGGCRSWVSIWARVLLRGATTVML
jgi:outer membrane murein-binding lipoprotein Lpp